MPEPNLKYKAMPKNTELKGYYFDELSKPFHPTEAPTAPRRIKVCASSGDTKFLDLNDYSATVLVKLLIIHYNIKL